ncbi:hypothetical protein SRHO_G00257050 [Serrasalmus rhombeus]
MMASESLILRVDVSDVVDVIYNSAGTPGPSSGQICTVDGPSLQCKPEYTQRSSLTSGVELRRMTPSDSGVYTVMDSRNKEVIHIHTVTVQAGAPPDGYMCLEDQKRRFLRQKKRRSLSAAQHAWRTTLSIPSHWLLSRAGTLNLGLTGRTHIYTGAAHAEPGLKIEVPKNEFVAQLHCRNVSDCELGVLQTPEVQTDDHLLNKHRSL